MIWPASIDDAPRAAALFRAIFDDRLVTVEGFRYRFESARPVDRLRCWRAEQDGELVGWAVGGLDALAPMRTAAFAGVVVHPAHRRAGIGSALWDVVSAHLDHVGARRIVVHSRADADSMAFAAGLGFSHEATETALAVDPRTIGPPPRPPLGIEIAPMSSFVDDPEPVFAADHESALDEPGPSNFSGMTDRETGRAANAGTGVIPGSRGRGLGLLMKQHSLAWAAAAGITKVITQNDETNVPMLAINARLGYKPFSVGHAWVLER